MQKLEESNEELAQEVETLRGINKSLNLVLNEKQNTILQLEQTKRGNNDEFQELKESYEKSVQEVNDLRSSIKVLNTQLNEKQNLVVQALIL